MRIGRALSVLVLLSATVAEAQSPATPAGAEALEGAWIRLEGINALGTANPSPPAVRTFVDGHYSWMQAQADRPLPDSTSTAVELRAIWGTVTASSGRYEVVGQTVTQYPIADVGPTGMTPGFSATFAYRLAGDTMWLTQIRNTVAGTLRNQGTGKYVRVR